MNILSIVISLFILLESLNVFLLYFFPESQKGNAMGAFKAMEKSKATPEIHNLTTYLINWVAGTKIIFIVLLTVIVVHGDPLIQFYSVIALIITIPTFYWRLFPLIKSMDKENQISPKGYSKTLGIMIAGFMIIFILAASYYFFFQMDS